MTLAVDEDTLQLPSPVTVQAALRTVTERFALEMAAPTSSAPQWSHFEWRTARAVAAMHGVTGILAGRLRWQGPEGWTEFLGEQRAHIAQRHRRIRELTLTTGEQLRSCGIPAQALKGAALHEAGLYRDGERPMADLDLLVSAQDVGPTTQVLEDLGLRESHRTFKHRVFVARHAVAPGRLGEHAANDIKVELHERICEPLPQRLIDISQLVQVRTPRPGLNPYPSPAALMIHLLLHAAGDMAARSLRLIQLHDIALLAPRLTATEWREVIERGSWWAWPPLSMAERYYGELAPRTAMARARQACSAILRHVYARQLVSDVSMSRLWVEAFPGIEWTQSLGEAADYVWCRLAPSAELRERRRFALQTEPSLTGSDWGAISQRRRILRFLTRRAARPWPLYNVRAALAQRR
jgi:hypothetical protein